METKEAYNIWAKNYDIDSNKTRDLEAIALKTTLSKIKFNNCLEIGSGTGKNTKWLLNKASQIKCVDLSEEMIAIAKEKIKSDKVKFKQADINQNWDFKNEKFDLITFSLVLEHIENLDKIFKEVSKVIKDDGYVYIGELHPFKQYSGSKARFETEKGLQVLNCFTHNISDFFNAAKNNNFEIIHINEFFDNDDQNNIPRILTLLFKRN
jgi:ubiquinone/menaquinone biosynthesis C-methylase UbiE